MTDLKICFLFLYLSERSLGKMEEYERLFLKATSHSRADEVWRSWYKKGENMCILSKGCF